MPFANHSSLVAGLLQKFGDEGHSGVNSLSQSSLPVLVTVKTGHQAGAAGCGQGILDIGLVEAYSFGSQAVHVRSRCLAAQGMAVGADGLIGMVIRHDVDDVQPLRGFLALGLRCKGLHCGYRKTGGNGD